MRETEPKEHVSETRDAHAARKAAEPGCKRGQLRPQKPSKVSAVVVATRQRTGHGKNQQPGGYWKTRTREAPDVQKKGYDKSDKAIAKKTA